MFWVSEYWLKYPDTRLIVWILVQVHRYWSQCPDTLNSVYNKVPFNKTLAIKKENLHIFFLL